MVLLILGIGGWLLEGADFGVIFYIEPDFERMGNIKIWTDAACK